MKKFCIILSILLASLLFAGNVDGRTFTQEEVLSIYAAAYTAMDKKYGSLQCNVNTAKHDNFRWTWDAHYIVVEEITRRVVLKRCHEHSSRGGYSYEIYYFSDYDNDGKLDRVSREYIIVDSNNLHVIYHPPEELQDAIAKWAHNIKNAQALYEAELEFWYNELKEEIENAD